MLGQRPAEWLLLGRRATKRAMCCPARTKPCHYESVPGEKGSAAEHWGSQLPVVPLSSEDTWNGCGSWAPVSLGQLVLKSNSFRIRNFGPLKQYIHLHLLRATSTALVTRTSDTTFLHLLIVGSEASNDYQRHTRSLPTTTLRPRPSPIAHSLIRLWVYQSNPGTGEVRGLRPKLAWPSMIAQPQTTFLFSDYEQSRLSRALGMGILHRRCRPMREGHTKDRRTSCRVYTDPLLAPGGQILVAYPHALRHL